MEKGSLKSKLINAPYLVWSAIFIIVPMIIVLYFAFTDSSGAFTLSNLFELKNYGGTLLLSLWYSVLATLICLVISFPLAYIMSKKSAGVQRMMMLLIMLPMWMNLLIRTYSWMNILENQGVINHLLGLVGLGPIKIIGTGGAVVFGMVYNYLPYMVMPIYTVLSKLDRSLLEAAEDLGSNAFVRFRKVILPLSVPGVISGITMVFVPSISTFYISQKLGGGKIMLIGDVIDRQMQQSYNYNLGAALSLILMVLILISMMIMNKFDKDGEMII